MGVASTWDWPSSANCKSIPITKTHLEPSMIELLQFVKSIFKSHILSFERHVKFSNLTDSKTAGHQSLKCEKINLIKRSLFTFQNLMSDHVRASLARKELFTSFKSPEFLVTKIKMKPGKSLLREIKNQFH